MTRLVIDNAAIVVTVNATDEVLNDVSIDIVDGNITAICPAAQITDRDGAHIIDATHRLVMPGLVNLHTHLPMALLRGIAEDVDLQGFLDKVWAAEAAIMDPPTVELGATLGAFESLRGGCTTQVDMYFHHQAAHGGAVRAGARHVGGPVFFDFPGPDGMSWQDRIVGLRTWAETRHDIGGPAAPLMANPHGTYTVSPEHLAELVTVMGELGGGVLHTHVSENEAENADVAERHNTTPIGALASAGWFDQHHTNVVLAHAVHITDADRAALGFNATLAHCPGSNMKLASGAFDWSANTDVGARIGIGTDGCSSSNDLDMWQAMRQAALLARLTSQQADTAPAVAVLRAATIDGARALGMGDIIGSIEVGKQADLLLLDLDQPHLTPMHDVFAGVVFAAGRGDVTDVIVDGQHVVADRRSTRLDEAELFAAARQRGDDV